MSKTEERRKLTRKYLAFFTRVFDRESGQLLGHLDNASTDGVMVIGETPIETNKNFHLRMELSEHFFNKDSIDFEASSIWCKPDLDPKFYNTGFQFARIDPGDKEIIEQIMQIYGIRE